MRITRTFRFIPASDAVKDIKKDIKAYFIFLNAANSLYLLNLYNDLDF